MNNNSFESFSSFVDIETGLSSSPYSNSRRSMDFSCSHSRHYFLDLCSLCDKLIGCGNDIYMYRGDAPFCSEECRKQQMDMDDAEERRMQQRRRRKEDKKKSAPCGTGSSKSTESYVTVTISG